MSSRALLGLILFSCDALGGKQIETEPPFGQTPPGETVPDPENQERARVAAGRRQIRLLSAAEYRSTVRDLLGVESDPNLAHGDWGAGYDTGSGAHLDENLFSILSSSAERSAASYVRDRIAIDHPCFDPNDLTDACVETIIDRLGSRAYRRSLGSAARAELMAFYRAAVGSPEVPTPEPTCGPEQPPPDWGVKDGQCLGSCGVIGGVACLAEGPCPEGTAIAGESYDCPLCCGPRPGGSPARLAAIELLVARMLMSPHFLYRTEIGLPRGAIAELDPFEKASLISYTLTGSMPDDRLLADAAADRLDGDRIREHVRRISKSERSRARIAVFFQQWLRATSLDEMVETPESFPKLESRAQAIALRDEMVEFVRSVVGEERTLTALLRRPHVHGEEQIGRKGVLTLAGVMAAHGSVGDPARDRPVKRGLLIKNRFLCEDVGLPSGIDTAAAAANVAAQVPNLEELTTREKFEAIMQQGDACRACHQNFMPYGFAFGNYDALGRHVTSYRGRPIDTAIADVPIEGELRAYRDAIELAEDLATREITARCFIRNFLGYTLGFSKGEQIDDLSRAHFGPFQKSGRDIPKLIEEVLSSPHLYQKRIDREDT